MVKNIDLKNLNIEKIHRALRSKESSSMELTKGYLDNIKSDKTNSFISINEHAIEEAEKADEMIAQGKDTILTGIPLAVKDIILVKGLRATAGSKMLENYVASYTATAVKRLQDAGMVILGKTNCDEFAMGSSNENSYFGPVLNPYDRKKVSGGSSGGSAAAVAADLAPVSLGTDTGGSIRQPAAFCGVYGLKPSYGRVSRYGSIAMASSLDQIGPLGKTVKDLAYLLQFMAGLDEKDATSAKVKLPDYSAVFNQDSSKLKIGIPQEYFNENLDGEIRQIIEDQIKLLEKQGFNIQPVSLPNTDYALAAYYLLMPAEVSSNLARFDGLLYGLSGKSGMSLDEWYKEVRSHGFGAETKRRIILGTYILSAGYYDAYYKQAQKVRTLIKNDFVDIFKKVDVLITPTTPSTAFAVGEKTQDPLQMYLSDMFTVGANIAGICGLSVPVARAKNNLPVGLQLLAGQFAEEKLFALGHTIENLNKK